MFDSLFDTLGTWFDSMAGYVWEMFEKDMRMMENIVSRTETIFVTIEAKIFGRSPRD